MCVHAESAGEWHTWAVHVPFAPHDAHAAPFLPQAVFEVPGAQTLFAQQPLGHDVGSQMHWP
jgi:hypothetical protein